ncbi:metallophosphoesterase [Adhaeribacter rhizoryzae]|uniref:Metallophosphoesterase n=1 Tax=Adhaeribacter rhizoryzae TaxID=2607907 RepID=A0A5M6DKG1_9BACT|nr:metallophosphoesterase [Adhaeribacter rhizoryzae]KAA5546690.1 metallophosphoesterase [Adhaeribacter rhizoryzae]
MHQTRFFIGVFLVVLLSFLLDRYVFAGIRTITANWKSTRLKKAMRWGYWAISWGVTTSMLVYPLFGMRNAFTYWLLSIFFTLFVTKLVFTLVLFSEDIIRLLTGVVKFIFKTNNSGVKPLKPGRRKFVSQLGLVLASIPFASFVYGMIKGKYDYKVHRHTLFFDDLPEAFDGFTITQISDVHTGTFDNAEAVQRGINMIKDQKSDLFVFTGDLVNNVAEEVEPWMNLFGQLRAPYGQFSILGNHDYGDYMEWESEAAKVANLDKLKKHHADMGYRLLLDENITLEKNGQKISLLGVENWGDGFIQKGDLEKALTGVDKDAFKILLSHDPSHWQNIVKHHPTHIHLTLAGHTHGMQMGIETPTVKWSPSELRYAHWAGLAEENLRYLYINRGFGFLGFTGRVGIWPEITVLELRKKAVA